MPRGYAGPPDPDKGVPYRRARAKIMLLLDRPDLPVDTYYQLMNSVLLKLAEKRPEDVLDAVLAVMGDGLKAPGTPLE